MVLPSCDVNVPEAPATRVTLLVTLSTTRGNVVAEAAVVEVVRLSSVRFTKAPVAVVFTPI
jgi:hypothetical protein